MLIKLPLPPTVNNAYGVNRKSGARYLKTAQKEYREAVIKLVRENKWDFQANVRLTLHIVLNFEDNRKNDLDNRIKPLWDACTHAKVWEDDSLIDDYHVLRGIVGKPGGVYMQLQAVEDADYGF